jgi:hypothetical protein
VDDAHFAWVLRQLVVVVIAVKVFVVGSINVEPAKARHLDLLEALYSSMVSRPVSVCRCAMGVLTVLDDLQWQLAQVAGLSVIDSDSSLLIHRCA